MQHRRALACPENRRRAVGYVRVSTVEQAAFGVSLAAQRKRLEAAGAFLGFDLAGVEEDQASGSFGPNRRPGLARALARGDSGDANCLVVVKLDRLSRSTSELLRIVERCQKAGIELISLGEQLDTASATGRFTLTVLAAVAEMERGLISERTAAGMAQVAAEGRACSRHIPFGYRIEGAPDAVVLRAGDRGQLVLHAAEQRMLARILEHRDAGKGEWATVSALNREGTLNPRTGRPWCVGSVRSILRTVARREASE